MKRELYISFLFALTMLSGFAQQDPIISHYVFDPLFLNPATSGSKNIVLGDVSYRNQFTGFEGAPITSKLSINGPIQSKNMGLGLNIYNDKAGATVTNHIGGVYSYHVGIGAAKFSLGVQAGVINQQTNFSDLIRTHQDDEALPLNRESVTVPDASFGMYYYSDNLSFGFSSLHLIQSKLNYTSYSRSEIARIKNHNYLTLNYKLELNDKFEIEPGVLVKRVKGAPIQFDGNLSLIWNKALGITATYRSGDAISMMLRYIISEKIIVGYAYDYRLSRLSDFSTGSHEVIIGYQIKLLPPSKEKIIDPRYYF